jgi:peptide/nickel transport system substrate-binding protein
LNYDLTAADKALKEAGYPMSTEKGAARKKGDSVLSFELLYPNEPLYKSLAELIKKDWEALGVQVSLVGVSYAQLVNERLEQRNYQAALVSLNFSRTPDPDPYPFWDQAQAVGGQNYTQWDSRMASEYLEQARILVDRDERLRFYRNFQVLFTQDMPALPLFYPVYTYAVDKQVRGVRMGPLIDSSDRFATVGEWFLETKKASPAILAPTVTK